jgi:hypothetical protein
MSYKLFKIAVLRRANWQCEVNYCDADCTSVHHMLKASRYPEFKEELKNGLAVCGNCHAEIERREREGISTDDMIPERRRLEAASLLGGESEGCK